MVTWCTHVPTFAYRHGHRPHTFSLRHFVKQLPSLPSLRSFLTSASLHSHRLAAMSPHQSRQIALYADALLHWNQKMNLTAVKEMGEVMRRHVEDSLAIVPVVEKFYVGRCGESCDGISLVDVGSGPGLPGIILAIVCPSWKVTLLESMQKRCSFLKHALELTGLSNVQIMCARAENVGQGSEYRESFDVAVARAVAEMRTLAEYCLPLVRVGGLFVAAKGHDPQEEVRNAEKAVRLMGASMLELCSVESQGPYGKRTAVVCLKDRPTPKRYPRQPGIPTKTPL